jgi:hypothetical protein
MLVADGWDSLGQSPGEARSYLFAKWVVGKRQQRKVLHSHNWNGVNDRPH